MLENPAFNEKNEKILCEMNGKNPEMHMNIWVKKACKRGEVRNFQCRERDCRAHSQGQHEYKLERQNGEHEKKESV